jgi:iron(III) transport system ATP-binding protein
VRTGLGSHPLRGLGFARDSQVTVLVRPEQVTLSGPELPGLMPGMVTATSYHGHDALVTIEVAGIGTVRARMTGAAVPAPGDKVALGVDGPVTAWSRR